MSVELDVSVIICAYTEERWDDLLAAVDSVRRQTRPAREIIVVIDHNPALLERVRGQLPDVLAVENAEAAGASGSRNTGVALAQGAIIAFLDDDAAAEPDWLALLTSGFADPKVLGVGGALEPVWLGGRPAWFPEEFNWVVGCTYKGLPETTSPVRNLIAANMSVRREVFLELGGFRNGYGNLKVNAPSQSRLLRSTAGDEETELCIRARQRWPNHQWLYMPRALARHRVPRHRGRWGYFITRCYDEGFGKAVLSCLVGARDGLASERYYTLQTLPEGITRGLVDLWHGDLAGVQRASAILAGLAVTGAGYLVGSIHSRLMSVVKPGGPVQTAHQKIVG